MCSGCPFIRSQRVFTATGTPTPTEQNNPIAFALGMGKWISVDPNSFSGLPIDRYFDSHADIYSSTIHDNVLQIFWLPHIA